MYLALGVSRLWYGDSPLRWLLWPVSLLYRVVLAGHRAWTTRGGRQSLPVPLVIVGNITVGGTGKTPTVIWLARQLTDRGLAVGIVSRGYGGSVRHAQVLDETSQADRVGDEPVLLMRRTSCPVAVARSRLAAAQALLEQQPLDVIISDDGLQHWRLQADVELAVVDGSRGLGNGLCLPAGPLREPARRLASVDAVIINGEGFDYPGAWRSRLEITGMYAAAGGEPRDIVTLRGTKVHAVAAIGNPQRFAAALEAAGLDVLLHAHPDHATLGVDDLTFSDGLPVLMTEKDAVKCPPLPSGSDLLVVAVELRVDQGDGLVETVLQRISQSG